MTPRIAYQSHPKAYFSNFRETFILNNPRMVLHRFYVSGDQNIHAKAAKKPPQKKYNKSSKKNQPDITFLTNNLEIDVQSALQRCPKIPINPAPDHPGTPRWPRQSQKVAQKLKMCVLGMKMASDAPNKLPCAPHKCFWGCKKRQDAQAKVALPLNRLQSIGAPGENKFKGRRHEASAI